MKIAVLNECFFKAHHLNKLHSLGELSLYSDTISEEDAIERLLEANIAIVDGCICPLNQRVLENTQNLQLLVLNTTGFDSVDRNTAGKKGIQIANVPGFSTQAVAEHTIGLLFAVNRNIPLADHVFRAYPEPVSLSSKDGLTFIGSDIKGKILGVIGLGRIGALVAQLGLALNMHVIGYNRTSKKIDNVHISPLTELLSVSDYISINLALTSDTYHILGDEEFRLMKPNAILINVGRADHVDTYALYAALREKRIRGAGLDTVDISPDHPLLKLNNVVFTPHIASFTKESLYNNLPDMIIQNIEAFIKGKPINIVSF